MKNRKKYSAEFKLQVVKDYLNSTKSLNDISKVPPFIYESAGIIKSDSNDSDDSALLKKKIEYYERLLLEKELLLKIQEDEINLLKKNEAKSNFYWSLFAYF